MNKAATVLALLVFLIAGGVGLYGQSTYTNLKNDHDKSARECEYSGDSLCGMSLAMSGTTLEMYEAEEMRNFGFGYALGGPIAIGLFVLLWQALRPALQRGAKAGGRIAVDAGRIAADEIGKRSSRVTKDVVGAVAQMSDSAQGRTRECPFCAEMIKPQAKVCRHCGEDVAPVALTTDR